MLVGRRSVPGYPPTSLHRECIIDVAVLPLLAGHTTAFARPRLRSDAVADSAAIEAISRTRSVRRMISRMVISVVRKVQISPFDDPAPCTEHSALKSSSGAGCSAGRCHRESFWGRVPNILSSCCRYTLVLSATGKGLIAVLDSRSGLVAPSSPEPIFGLHLKDLGSVRAGRQGQTFV